MLLYVNGVFFIGFAISFGLRQSLTGMPTLYLNSWIKCISFLVAGIIGIQYHLHIQFY